MDEGNFEDYNPLDDVDYYVNPIDGTVNITNDDGSGLIIYTEDLSSQEVDADGNKGPKVALIGLLNSQIPEDMYNIPIRLSGS